MKGGHALCISCGREPEQKKVPGAEEEKGADKPKSQLEITLEKKMESLSKDLENESDHQRQHEILRLINSTLETLEKLKSKQQQ